MHTTMKIAGGGAVALAFALAVPAFAQERAAPPIPTAYRAEAQVHLRANASTTARRPELPPAGPEADAMRRAETERVHALAAGATTTLANREEMRAQAEARVKEVKAAAQARLAQVRDRVKQQAIERVTNQFAHLNETWTKHFTEVLGRLSDILGKIQDRANTDAANGKDVTAVTAAITAATDAIASAKAAVDAQAAMTYAPDVPAVAPTTDATTTPSDTETVKEFRSAFAALHTTLFDDLKALRDGAMTDARTAVQAALKALEYAEGVPVAQTDASTTATTTGQ